MQKEVYKRHIKNYSNHWWFQARKKIIEAIIKKNILKKNISILDFGSGSGVNVNMLSKYGHVNIYEPHLVTRNYLRKKFNSKKYSVLKEYTKKKFDLILLADVLEPDIQVSATWCQLPSLSNPLPESTTFVVPLNLTLPLITPEALFHNNII